MINKKRKVQISITVDIETTKTIEQIKAALERGIYKGLDTEPNYIAPPADVKISTNVLWSETFKYCLLVRNEESKFLKQQSTMIESPFMPTEFALIERQCYDNYQPEKVNRIIYSDDLCELSDLMKTYISWYDYVTGYYKEMQQNVYKITSNGTD